MSDVKLIDQFLAEIDSLAQRQTEEHEESTTLSLWVSKGYKEKFDELQDRTDQDFGKKLKDLVYAAIDHAINKL